MGKDKTTPDAINNDDFTEIPVIIGHDYTTHPVGWMQIRKSALKPYLDMGVIDRVYFAPAFTVEQRGKEGIITGATLLEVSLMVGPEMKKGKRT